MKNLGWSPPSTFDEYRLLRILGRGGMGEVFLAEDTLLDRLVAVKFISDLQPDAEARKQFSTEARAAARIQHPNVVVVYRVGELDGRPFIISEFVRGTSLEALQTPIKWRRALELGIGLSRGLAAAHRRGVLHRDIKLGNAIIADDGEVKLLDFGLAKLLDRAPGPPSSSSTDGAHYSKEAPTMVMPRLHPADVDPASAPRPILTPRPSAGALRGVQPAGVSPLAITLAAIQDQPPVAKGTSPLASSRRHRTTVQGTPHYMAPELWRGESATCRSDVYSLGVVLYQLCAGATPHSEARLDLLAYAVVTRNARPLAEIAPDVDPRFAAIVDRCLRRDPTERFASGEELRQALEQINAGTRDGALPEGNPYRGLLPFGAEHRALFFGRAAEIGTVLDRLRSEPLVVIAGDSGVGKSSLCAAGVLPRIVEGALGEGRVWSTSRLAPGRHPVAALATALAEASGGEEDTLTARIREAPASLGRDLRRRLGASRGHLFYVDQLEELVTVSNPEEARVVGEALGHLASRLPGIRVMATVRSDFLARAASVPGLGDDLARALYLLRPLPPDRIREAIVGPALAKGASFESEALVQELVASTGRAEGLPLLQFALAELWEARDDTRGPITAEALSAIGGVTGALARHADRVLLGLPMEQRAAARRILVMLVTIEGTRAGRTKAELGDDPDAHAALEALVRGRLLVAHHAEHGTVYEVAHEALLVGWETLRRWMEELRGSRAVRERLAAAAGDWERMGHAPEALWGQRHLAEAAALDPDKMAPGERAFLTASARALRRERRTRQAAVIGLTALFLLVFAVVQMKMRYAVDSQVSVHRAEAEASLEGARAATASADALRTEAFIAFDAAQPDEGERKWARSIALAAEADQRYGRAGQALEAALTVGGGRPAEQELLADVLYERALAAERDHRPEQRDDLLSRMALYDLSGERRARWSAPARLTVETSPTGAQVTLERYVDDDRQKQQLTAARALGATPTPEIALPPGSYLLTLERDGHALVRYPVLLTRGKELRLSIDLPETSAVPQGFLYIPPGRFLFGSSSDEAVRRQFLSAPPIHEVTTGAFLIARYETTYADWLRYLAELPPGEREGHTGPVGKGGLTGAVQLVQRSGSDWQLTFQPASRSFTARSGELIFYASRAHRAVHNWLRLPVSGISADEAVGYTAWLDRTGRVPGARLCTEVEWERAARGADEREFPGGARLEPDDANFDETYGRDGASMGPDEIGSYPGSRSPFGLDDTAGNIFEWTRSITPGQYVIRGGSYFYGQFICRSTNRTTIDPSVRDFGLGLRVCASFPRPGAPPPASP